MQKMLLFVKLHVQVCLASSSPHIKFKSNSDQTKETKAEKVQKYGLALH